MNFDKRVQREKDTVKKLIHIYCTAHHSVAEGGFCKDCEVVYDYACDRIDHCVYGVNKPTCENCPIHCYNKNMQDKIKIIMRYSGPRMTYKHPIEAVRHVVNKRISKKIISKKSDKIKGL